MSQRDDCLSIILEGIGLSEKNPQIFNKPLIDLGYIIMYNKSVMIFGRKGVMI